MSTVPYGYFLKWAQLCLHHQSSSTENKNRRRWWSCFTLCSPRRGYQFQAPYSEGVQPERAPRILSIIHPKEKGGLWREGPKAGKEAVPNSERNWPWALGGWHFPRKSKRKTYCYSEQHVKFVQSSSLLFQYELLFFLIYLAASDLCCIMRDLSLHGVPDTE